MDLKQTWEEIHALQQKIADYDFSPATVDRLNELVAVLDKRVGPGAKPRPVHRRGEETYRVTVTETRQREFAVYATSPQQALDRVHARSATSIVGDTVVKGSAATAVVSVARLTLNGPARTSTAPSSQRAR